VSNGSDKQYEGDRERQLEEIRRRAEEAELKRLDDEERAQHPEATPLQSLDEPPPPPDRSPTQEMHPDEELEVQPYELLQEARQLYQRERYDKALVLVQKVLDIFPGLGEAAKLQDDIERAQRLADVIRKEEARHKAAEIAPLPPQAPARPVPAAPDSDIWGPTIAASPTDGILGGPGDLGPVTPPPPPLLDRVVDRLSRVHVPVRPVLISIGILAAILVGYLVIDNLMHAVVPPQQVLLILPAIPGSADEGARLLADGLTEDLIQTVGCVPHLRVISSVSSLGSRSFSVRPQQLAKNMKSGFALIWNVQLRGDALVCSASLQDTVREAPIWKVSFESTLRDLPAHRQELARQIVGAMHVDLPSSDNPFGGDNGRNPVNTFGQYLQARALARSPSPGALQRSLELLQSVVATDSSWGEGWAALGWVAMLAMEQNPDAPRTDAVNALSYIQRAVARGDRTAETFRAWGMIETFNADYPKAVERFQEAIKLCPGDAESQYRLALMLTLRGKKEDALRAAQDAAQWDPLNPEVITTLGIVQQFQGDFRAAEQSYQRAVHIGRERADRAADLHTDILVYLQHPDEAFIAATDMAAQRRDDPLYHYRLGRVAQIAGQPMQEWQSIFRHTRDLIAERLRTAPDAPEMLILLALTQTRLGQFKDALDADGKALHAAPENLDVLYGTARMYALQRDQKQAAAYLGQAVDRRYDLGRIVDMDLFNLRADEDFLRAITR
jgi:tetratricopeptide (TPR) repeat protein